MNDLYHFQRKKTSVLNSQITMSICEQTTLAGVITVNDDYKTTLAFGESQLLGLDSSDKNKPFVHDLLKIFPNRNFIIYAAPNNGPFEVFCQISQTIKISLRRTGVL